MEPMAAQYCKNSDVLSGKMSRLIIQHFLQLRPALPKPGKHPARASSRRWPRRRSRSPRPPQRLRNFLDRRPDFAGITGMDGNGLGHTVGDEVVGQFSDPGTHVLTAEVDRLADNVGMKLLALGDDGRKNRGADRPAEVMHHAGDAGRCSHILRPRCCRARRTKTLAF
jgi:hypothetical protein